MLLGDEVSITLGTDLHKYRQLYLIITSIVIGFIVYSSGMIGFGGLIIPHLEGMIFGTDHKGLLCYQDLLEPYLWFRQMCYLELYYLEANFP